MPHTSTKKRILWLTWKDASNPLAGGAEVVASEIGKRLVADGHEVTFLVGGYTGAKHEDTKDGYRIIRVGGRFSVYYHAYQYYAKNFKHDDFDIVIEEVNTIPFFSQFYIKSRRVLFFHQLAREIWFYQMPFPLSVVGYIAEPFYLRLLLTTYGKVRTHTPVLTISESSRRDLMKYGFRAEDISIISEGVHMEPVADLTQSTKYPVPTVLSVGSVRPMKRTVDILRAFEHAKAKLPTLTLIVAGDMSGTYGEKVALLTERSPHSSSITLLGRITEDKKRELMERAHVICVTSVKEGWGLIVTEAARLGTPACVYDVDGLRDSVKNEITGLVSMKNTPLSLAESVVELLSSDTRYQDIRRSAYDFSKTVTFEKQYADFKHSVGI